MVRSNSNRRRGLSTAALGITLTASFALTGCSNPLQGVIDSVGSSAADSIASELTDGQVQGLGTTEIPADFPQNIPLPDATPHSVVRHEENGSVVWMIQYHDGPGLAEFNALAEALTANGYAEESNSDLAGAMRMAIHANSEYRVNLSLLGPDDDEQILQIGVVQRSD